MTDRADAPKGPFLGFATAEQHEPVYLDLSAAYADPPERSSIAISADEAWTALVDQAAQFYARHARLPRRASQDEHEAVLGAWLHEARRKAAKGLPPATPDRVAYLERELPEFKMDGTDLD